MRASERPIQPPVSGFIPALHGLRGMAALGVLLFHWNSFFPALNLYVHGLNLPLNPFWPINFGWLGVSLFFVLSGYLLGGKLLAADLDGPTIRRYWKRRFLRIYPAVWLQIPVLLLAAIWLPHAFDWPKPAEIAQNALLWIHFPPNHVSPLNGVWWTLPIELMFYVVLPGVIWLGRRTGWPAVLAGALLLGLAWRWMLVQTYGDTGYLSREYLASALPASLATFVYGLLLNFAPRVSSPWIVRAGLALFVAAYVATTAWLRAHLATYWSGDWLFLVWNPLMHVSIALLVWLALQPGIVNRVMSTRALEWLGEVSYGVYLWHFPVLIVLRALVGNAWNSAAGSSVALLATLALTLPLAWLSYTLVERPVMGWARRRTREPA